MIFILFILIISKYIKLKGFGFSARMVNYSEIIALVSRLKDSKLDLHYLEQKLYAILKIFLIEITLFRQLYPEFNTNICDIPAEKWPFDLRIKWETLNNQLPMTIDQFIGELNFVHHILSIRKDYELSAHVYMLMNQMIDSGKIPAFGDIVNLLRMP